MGETTDVRQLGWPRQFQLVLSDATPIAGRRSETCDICGAGCTLWAIDRLQLLLDRGELDDVVIVLACPRGAALEFGVETVRQLIRNQAQWLN